MCNKSATNCRTLKIKAPLYCQTSNAAKTPSLDKLLHCHIKILNKYRNQSSLVVSDQSNHQSRHNQESLIIEIIINHKIIRKAAEKARGENASQKKVFNHVSFSPVQRKIRKRNFIIPHHFCFSCVCVLWAISRPGSEISHTY